MKRRPRTWIVASLVAVAVVTGMLLPSPIRGPEPPPPTAWLRSTNQPLVVSLGLGGALFVLPDGSLWGWGRPGGWGSSRYPAPTQIGTENDWAFAAAGNNIRVAIKTNGTLWQQGHVSAAAPRAPAVPLASGFRKMGEDTDWSIAACADVAVAAVKRDGSLWTWGDAMGEGTLGDPTVLTRPLPGRVGTNLWRTVVGGMNYGFLAIDRQDRLQAWGKPHQPGPRFPRPTEVQPETHWLEADSRTFLDATLRLWSGSLDDAKLQVVLTNASPQRYAIGPGCLYEIAADGSLHRRVLDLPLRARGFALPWPKPGRVGLRKDWVRLWHGGAVAMGLTADGMLWVWGADYGSEAIRSPTSRIKTFLIDRVNAVRHLLGWRPLAYGTLAGRFISTSEPRPFLQLASITNAPPEGRSPANP